MWNTGAKRPEAAGRRSLVAVPSRHRAAVVAEATAASRAEAKPVAREELAEPEFLRAAAVAAVLTPAGKRAVVEMAPRPPARAGWAVRLRERAA